MMSNVNVPNAFTAVRLFGAPFIPVALFVTDDRVSILYFAIFLGLTDIIDGRWAKWFGSVTILGKQLDPLADKVFCGSLFVGLFVECGVNSLSLFTFGIPALVLAIYAGRMTELRSAKRVLDAIQLARWKTAVLMGALIGYFGTFVAGPIPVPFGFEITLPVQWAGWCVIVMWTSTCMTLIAWHIYERLLNVQPIE